MSDTAGRRGSVRKDKRRGTFTVVVDIAPVGEIARRQLRRRGFATEREAQRALTGLLTELDAGTFVAPDPSTTLASYVAEVWLPALRVKQLRASTLESYQRNLDVHVLPRLGRRPLSAIRTPELDRLYSELSAGGVRGPLAPRTVRYGTGRGPGDGDRWGCWRGSGEVLTEAEQRGRRREGGFRLPRSRHLAHRTLVP